MHISFATTGLHGICNGSKNRMEDGGRVVTHSSLTALGLGISAPPPPPTRTQFPSLVRDWDGGTKVFYPPRPDYRRLKIPSITSPSHNHSHVCDPTATFSFSRKVIRYQLGNPCIIMQYRIYSQYHIMREKVFRALTPLPGGGGGLHAPPPPWDGTDKIVN